MYIYYNIIYGILKGRPLFCLLCAIIGVFSHNFYFSCSLLPVFYLNFCVYIIFILFCVIILLDKKHQIAYRMKRSWLYHSTFIFSFFAYILCFFFLLFFVICSRLSIAPCSFLFFPFVSSSHNETYTHAYL